MCQGVHSAMVRIRYCALKYAKPYLTTAHLLCTEDSAVGILEGMMLSEVKTEGWTYRRRTLHVFFDEGGPYRGMFEREVRVIRGVALAECSILRKPRPLGSVL